MVNVMHSVLKLAHDGYLFENGGGVELNAELFIDTNLIAYTSHPRFQISELVMVRAACERGKAHHRVCSS
jgi:hypothetical protein